MSYDLIHFCMSWLNDSLLSTIKEENIGILVHVVHKILIIINLQSSDLQADPALYLFPEKNSATKLLLFY